MPVYRPLYVKDFSPQNWRVAAIYERLCVRRMQHCFEDAHFYHSVAGTINGQTFGTGVVMLKAVLYDPETDNLFAECIKKSNNPAFTPEEVKAAVADIECRDFISIKYEYEQLSSVLLAFDKTAWLAIQDYTYKDFDPNLAITNKSRVASVIKPQLHEWLRIDLSLPERCYGDAGENLAIFIRLSVIMIDAIRYGLDKIPNYLSREWVAYRYQRFTRTRVEFTIKQGVSERVIQECVDIALKTFVDDAHMPLVQKHLLNWSGDPASQQKLGISYFENTDMLVGGKGMSKIATPERIVNVVRNTEIKIRVMQPSEARIKSWREQWAKISEE